MLRDDIDEHQSKAAQFELYLAAELVLTGLSVVDGEPDLRFAYGSEDVGIAAKRLVSDDRRRMRRRAREAAAQIRGSGLRGWIALNIDLQFANLDLAAEAAGRLRQVEEILDEMTRFLRQYRDDGYVMGVALYGDVASNTIGSEGEPVAGDTLTLSRWLVASADPVERSNHQLFLDGRWGRWEKAMDQLIKPDFDGTF
jgi:hypothetical protein